MSRESDNQEFARLSQRWLVAEGHPVSVDGWAGPRTRAAWESQTGFAASGDADEVPLRPASDDRSLRAFYGEPGDESNLVYVELPYEMRLAWNLSVTVTRARCHRLVADPLRAALEGVLRLYGADSLADMGLDRFGGVYNFRRQRGSGSGRPWSLHAWGAAVDLDPARNRLDMPWPHAEPQLLARAQERWRRKHPGTAPQMAKMPIGVVEQFERVGWKSGARAWGRDAMHFQWTL